MSTGEHTGGGPASAEAFRFARTYIERFFTVVNLMTEASGIRVISPEADCGEVIAYLKDNGYDIAVSSTGAAAPGCVALESIEGKEGPVSPYITTIRPEEKITPDATVMDVIDGLRRSDYLFVFEKQGDFRGLVTYADLGKPPVRAVCFIAISEFEHELRQAAKIRFPSNVWLQRLSDGSQKEIGAVYVAEKTKGIETSLLDCSSTHHLKEIFQKDGGWLEAVGYRSKDDFKRSMNAFIGWRNRVMHGRSIVADREAGRSLYAFISGLAQRATDVKQWLALAGTGPTPSSEA